MAYRILVVDDSEENRWMVKYCLAADGYEVAELESGQKLLDLGEKVNDFDLILLDVMMPNLNGFETCRLLKNQKFGCHIPVIFLTAETEEDSRVSGFEAGGIDYILKPFGRKELGMRVKSHLALSQRLNEVNNKNETLQANLKRGAEIQNAFLPSKSYNHPNFNIAWDYRPIEHVAGDMFGFIEFDDGSLGVYLLDVCGHGTSAALVASAVYGAITTNRELMGHNVEGKYLPRDPGEFLVKLSKHFPYEKYESYFTFSYVLVNSENSNVKVSVAGHPPPYLIAANEVQKIDVIGSIMGIDLESSWESKKNIFNKEAKILIVSDGVLELMNEHGRFDKYIDLLLSKYSTYGAESLVKTLHDEVDEFVKNWEVKDDLTIICIENK